MKLHEVIQPARQFMTDYNQIENWLIRYNVHHYTIHSNGVVDCAGNVDLRRENLTHIPIQFGKVDGSFRCGDNKLTSLIGCPYYVGNVLSCYDNNIKSLSGIHQVIKFIGHQFSSDDGITNILGLMLIDGLPLVNIDSHGPIDRILNSHLQGNRDIHQCQEELIEAGFAAQAKL